MDELTRRRLDRDLPALRRGTTTILVTHSVIEAVMLADRLIVLSPRPAAVVAEIDAAPARPDAPPDPAFRDVVEAVAAALEASASDRALAAQ